MTSSSRLYGALTARSGCPAPCCPSSRTSRKATSPVPLSHFRTVAISTRSGRKFTLISGPARRLRRCAHARFVAKALGRRVDRAPGAPARRMDVERTSADRLVRAVARWGRGLQRDLVLDRLHMVGEQHFPAVDAVQLAQTFDE